MKSTKSLSILKNQFFTCVSMLIKIIEICPDELWNCKKSGFVFWQQLLHAFAGMHYWLREDTAKFTEPFKEKNVYPEMEKDPENPLSKDELIQYCSGVRETTEKWFDNKDDEWLNESSKIMNAITNMDVIIMQIKHAMYHIGHCEAIFRENGVKSGEYIDF